MRATLIDSGLNSWRDRWPVLLAVAGLTLGPAVTATTIVDVLAARGDAIVNGALISYGEPTVWTRVVLTAASGAAQARVSVPILVVLAWFIGLATTLPILAGRPVRTAWRRVPPTEWLALGALLAALTLVGLQAAVAAAGHLGAPAGWLTAALWTYGLARLALALPAMLVDGRRLPKALRHVVVARHGHAATVALIVVTVVAPAVILALLGPGITPTGRTWVGNMLWSGVASLLEYLILLLALPAQATGLLAAYRAVQAAAPAPAASTNRPHHDPTTSTVDGNAPDGPGEASPAADGLGLTVTVHDLTDAPPMAGHHRGSAVGVIDVVTVRTAAPERRPSDVQPADAAPTRPRSAPRWLWLTAVPLLTIVPAVAGPAMLLANPNRLPVLTVARPEAGLVMRPLTFDVLDDGSVVIVDTSHAARCRDEHCTDVDLLSMPCIGGARPAPEGTATRGCPTVGPIRAADVTSDGTLLALVHDPDQTVRLFWCQLEPTDDGQCRWGGQTTLYQLPDQWWELSMAVTALPGGGFAAAILAPGLGETTITVRLITCERLDCPQPTVHIALFTERPAVPGSVVDIAVDSTTGNLALGYLDRTDDSLHLGGCQARCPDGPTMNWVGRWRELVYDTDAPDHPDLQVLATATGPTAALTSFDALSSFRLYTEVSPGVVKEITTRVTAVMTCDNPGCYTFRRSHLTVGMEAMTLVANPGAEAYLVGTWRNHLMVKPLHGEWSTGWPFDVGTVAAAAHGPDGRLRLLTHDDQGPMLVALTHPVLRNLDVKP